MRILALLSILTLMVSSCCKEKVEVSCLVDDQRPNYKLFEENPFYNSLLLSDKNVLIYSIAKDYKALLKMDVEGNVKWKLLFDKEIYIHEFYENLSGEIDVIYYNKDKNFFFKKLNSLGETIIDKSIKRQVAKTNWSVSYISDNQY